MKNLIVGMVMLGFVLPTAANGQTKSFDFDAGYRQFGSTGIQQTYNPNPMINSWSAGYSRRLSAFHDLEFRLGWTHESRPLSASTNRNMDLVSFNTNLKLFPVGRRFVAKPFLGFGLALIQIRESEGGFRAHESAAGFNLFAGSVFRLTRHTALTARIGTQLDGLERRDVGGWFARVGLKLYLN